MNYLILTLALLFSSSVMSLEICDEREYSSVITTISFLEGEILTTFTYDPPVPVRDNIVITRDHFRVLIDGVSYFPSVIVMENVEITSNCDVILSD